MAKQEVEIVSREILKPTDHSGGVHPKTHTLSLFDQIAPPIYMPLIFFYHSDEILSITSMLRASLAVTLCDFYPLAGRISGDHAVDCNDGGVVFVEARVVGSCSAREFLGENVSVTDESLKLLGPDGGRFGCVEAGGSIPLAVQVTSFCCGTTAVYISFHHSVMDMAGFSYFLRTWGAHANGSGILSPLPPPVFNLSAIYPPADDLNIDNIIPPDLIPEPQPKAFIRSIHARVVFDEPMIKAMKEAARSEDVQNPTAVEVVTALIHLTSIKAAATANPNRTKGLMQPVNLRSRVVAPLSESAIGNLVRSYRVTIPTAEEATLAGVVRVIRREKYKFLDAIQAMNKDELRSVTLEERRGVGGKETPRRPSDKLLMVNSWCGFGLSGLDFGWGNPIAVVVPGPRWDLLVNGESGVVLVDKKRGNVEDAIASGSIEGYVMLEETEMAVFLRDEKLLAFARINPHPFD